MPRRRASDPSGYDYTDSPYDQGDELTEEELRAIRDEERRRREDDDRSNDYYYQGRSQAYHNRGHATIPDPPAGYSGAGYGTSGGGTGGDGGFDTFGIPVVDEWSGNAAERAEAERLRDKYERERAWGGLAYSAPDAFELTPGYYLESGEDEWGSLAGGSSELEDMDQAAQMRALRDMQRMYERGGYTGADQAASVAGRLNRGQWMRGQNQAVAQQMAARGLGGGGAELAARLNSAQAANMGNAQADAQIQQAAMQRAMQSLQMQGSLSSTMQDQEMQRRNAIDAFNQQNMGYRRDREARNTQTVNRQQDARRDARQQAWENQRSVVAGWDGQYAANTAARQRDREQNSGSTDQILAALGGVAAMACCHPRTLIDTPQGPVPIGELRAGDHVISVHRGRVVSVPLRAVQRIPVTDHIVQRVRLANGVALEITPAHPTADGYALGELRAGDLLGGVEVMATEPVPFTEPATFDILPESDSATYFCSGVQLGSTMRSQR